MATYVNNLRLTELATGEGAGTWGTTTNSNLEFIGEALGFGTQAAFASDADSTTTVADGSTDPARAMYFKVTSSGSLSTTRVLTIAPNTLSRLMYIENATSGSQSIQVSQGSGANVTIANGEAAIVYLDGAGSGAAVVDANTALSTTKINTATLAIGGTSVTSTAAELNLVDGSTADTVVNSKAVIYGSAGQITANELDVDNIQIDSNAVKSTNTNGNIQLFPNGTGFTELYGNTNAGAVRFNCEANTHGVTLKGPPHSASATYSLELPNADGSAGQLLKTDGSGKLAFTSDLPGITATATEINKLDGVTATTTELNYVDVSTLGTTEASKAVTADANGVVTFDNGTIEEATTISSSSNAATINLRDGDNFEHTLTEAVTYTFSNPASSGRVSAFTLKVKQDSSASGYAITWPSSVDWPSATAPTQSSSANAIDVYVFVTYDGGTIYYGFVAGQDMG
jgi:hypothetical protein